MIFNRIVIFHQNVFDKILWYFYQNIFENYNTVYLTASSITPASVDRKAGSGLGGGSKNNCTFDTEVIYNLYIVYNHICFVLLIKAWSALLILLWIVSCSHNKGNTIFSLQVSKNIGIFFSSLEFNTPSPRYPSLGLLGILGHQIKSPWKRKSKQEA